MKKKLEILLTNDDSFTAKGFRTLITLCSAVGNVTCFAPRTPQSGKSAALSMETPLYLKEEETKTAANGNKIVIYSFTGTPADCVKMAMNTVFSRNCKPDILISGINHGSNASTASVYSGTLGATAEGTIYGITSVALSLDTHNPEADFTAVEKYFPSIIENVLKNPPKEGIYLNINFPNIPLKDIKGVKFARQGKGMWVDEFERYTSPKGTPYYWISGRFLDQDSKKEGDHTLLKEGYITIVPHRLDTTDNEEIKRLSGTWKIKI